MLVDEVGAKSNPGSKVIQDTEKPDEIFSALRAGRSLENEIMLLVLEGEMTFQLGEDRIVVYEFALNPENLPQWVRSFCLSVRKSDDEWQMETPTGWVGIRFVSVNEFGVLDSGAKQRRGLEGISRREVVRHDQPHSFSPINRFEGLAGQGFSKIVSKNEASSMHRTE
jgi:hypothetical protein